MNDMMEFVHMFHERTGHRYPTSSFGVRRRRGGPESRHHHDGDWPWGWQRQDFGHGCYESVDDDNDDDDGRPGGGTSSPLNGHAGPEENPFENRSSDRWQRFGPNHHHASSPMRDMPEVFSAPGVTTTPAYSVEEPTTPPLTDDAFFPRLFPVPVPPHGHRNPGPRSPPPDRSRRQRRKSRHGGGAHAYTSSSPFSNRSPLGHCFDDGAHLPPLTERCETLPSSASSTPPSTPSRRPLSPTPSPRARSPDSFTRHVYRDTDGEDHRHRSPPYSFRADPPPPPSSPFFHRHHHHHHHHHPPPPSPLSPHPSPPSHYQQHHQHMLLSAHQRTRRQLRALERELERLGGAHDRVFDHYRQDDGGGPRARGAGASWGLDGLGRREDWGGGHFRRGSGGLGSW